MVLNGFVLLLCSCPIHTYVTLFQKRMKKYSFHKGTKRFVSMKYLFILLVCQVRSLDLDEWPPGHLAVMGGLGNQLANSVWEARIVAPYRKPGPDSTRSHTSIIYMYYPGQWIRIQEGKLEKWVTTEKT